MKLRDNPEEKKALTRTCEIVEMTNAPPCFLVDWRLLTELPPSSLSEATDSSTENWDMSLSKYPRHS